MYSLPNVLSREYSRVSHSTCMGQPTPLSESQLITSRHQFISVPLRSLDIFYDFPNMQHSIFLFDSWYTWTFSSPNSRSCSSVFLWTFVICRRGHFADRFRETAAISANRNQMSWLEINRETSFFTSTSVFILLVFSPSLSLSLSLVLVRNFYDPGHEKMWSNGYNRRPGRRIISVWYIDTCVCV